MEDGRIKKRFALSSPKARQGVRRFLLPEKFDTSPYFYMVILVKFEWDEDKRSANIAKHGVDFHEAIKAFADPSRILEITYSKSAGREPRYCCIGHDGTGIATINFTLRGGVIRLINAGYWRKGKREYEKNQLHR